MMLTRISNLLLELNKPDIVIGIPTNSAKTFEFHKASKLIKKGREVANYQIRDFLLQKRNNR